MGSMQVRKQYFILKHACCHGQHTAVVVHRFLQEVNGLGRQAGRLAAHWSGVRDSGRSDTRSIDHRGEKPNMQEKIQDILETCTRDLSASSKFSRSGLSERLERPTEPHGGGMLLAWPHVAQQTARPYVLSMVTTFRMSRFFIRMVLY